MNSGVKNYTLDLAEQFHFRDTCECLCKGMVRGDGSSYIEGPSLFYVCLKINVIEFSSKKIIMLFSAYLQLQDYAETSG